MKILVTGYNGKLASELKKISNGYNNLSWTFTSKKDLKTCFKIINNDHK